MNCLVCLTDHSEALHAATLRLREHNQAKRKLAAQPVSLAPKKPNPYPTELRIEIEPPMIQKDRKVGVPKGALIVPGLTVERIRELRDKGLSMKEIGDLFGCCRQTVGARMRGSLEMAVEGRESL